MILSKKIITHCGARIMQVVQKNSKDDGYSRYFLPTDGDKNAAIKINGYLSREEAEQLIGEKI